jgi:hypothetical protein
MHCFRPRAAHERLEGLLTSQGFKVRLRQAIAFQDFLRLITPFKLTTQGKSVLRFVVSATDSAVNNGQLLVTPHAIGEVRPLELSSESLKGELLKVRVEDDTVKDLLDGNLFFRTQQGGLFTPVFNHPLVEPKPVHLGLMRDTVKVKIP